MRMVSPSNTSSDSEISDGNTSPEARLALTSSASTTTAESGLDFTAARMTGMVASHSAKSIAMGWPIISAAL